MSGFVNHFLHITSKQIIARIYHNSVFQELFTLIVLLHYFNSFIAFASSDFDEQRL